MLDFDSYLIVTDLKQYTHCPRIIFYERCLPHIRPRTYKMDAGKQAHEDEQERSARRTLRQYNEIEGERHFSLNLSCHKLGLRGELDELVITATGEMFPIDYKLAKTVGHHHRLQLAAYALLLESYYPVVIQTGFIYLIPKRQTIKVIITKELRQLVIETLNKIQTVIVAERMPSATSNLHYCSACEFRRFCNDVI